MSLTIRSSSLPLLFRCQGAVFSDGIRVDPINPAAGAGTAAHAVLAHVVTGGDIEPSMIASAAADNDCDEDEVRMLVHLGAKNWRTLAPRFPSPRVEVSLSAEVAPGIILTGHPDVLAVVGTTAMVIDHKTGRADALYRDQVISYLVLMMLDDPSLTGGEAAISWVRDGEVEWHRISRDEVQAWIDRLIAAATTWDHRTFRPGAQCTFCVFAHSCPAASALVRRDVAAVAGYCEPVDLSALDAVALVELHERVGVVDRIAGRLKDALKAEVRARGPIEANGVRLEVVTEARREIDPLAAWPVLEAAGFTDKDFAETMTLGVGKVEKRVADKAGRGNGAGAVRALAESMTAAGAVRLKPRETLERSRA